MIHFGMRLILCFRVLVAMAVPPVTAFAQSLTVTQQRMADVQYVATQLPALHPNFFFQLSEASFNAAVEMLLSKIPNLTDAEFAVGLAQLVAMAGDPHTALYINGPTFPLSFRALDNGIFVTGAAQQYSQALGTKLVGIGETDISAVLTALGTVIPHTNPQWVAHEAQNYLRVQSVLQGLDLVPASGSSSLTFQDAVGNRFSLDVSTSNESLIQLPSQSTGPLPDFVRNAKENYWFAYFPPQQVLYFKYNVCADDPSNPFDAFAANLLNTFDSNPVSSLVFDFRGNTGGDTSVIQPILAGFQQRIPAISANPNFRAYDVIDGGTFSSGLDGAMELKTVAGEAAAQFPALANALVTIGSPSGGPPAGFGEVQPFTLPYLGLSGQYSTSYHPLPEFIPAGKSFNPQIPVSNRSTDYFARYDPVLGAIFAESSAPPASPSGGTLVVSAASFRTDAGVAPGSLAAAFGTFPANVDEVFINGAQAQIVTATATQVNFIVPANAAAGAATISLRAAGTAVSTGQFTITPSGIGIFVVSSDPSQPGAILNPDYSVNTQSNPTAQGSYLQLYAKGFAQSTEVMFADTPGTVLYSGPSGSPGIWQINVTVPSIAAGQTPVYVIADNTVSNAVTVWLK
ncbi:MAG: hypothetical protein JO099_11730 [Acidobacteriia bacterium]|nr:hypothetical protein [Terriglobia bacterium]